MGLHLSHFEKWGLKKEDIVASPNTVMYCSWMCAYCEFSIEMAAFSIESCTQKRPFQSKLAAHKHPHYNVIPRDVSERLRLGSASWRRRRTLRAWPRCSRASGSTCTSDRSCSSAARRWGTPSGAVLLTVFVLFLHCVYCFLC